MLLGQSQASVVRLRMDFDAWLLNTCRSPSCPLFRTSALRPQTRTILCIPFLFSGCPFLARICVQQSQQHPLAADLGRLRRLLSGRLRRPLSGHPVQVHDWRACAPVRVVCTDSSFMMV